MTKTRKMRPAAIALVVAVLALVYAADRWYVTPLRAANAQTGISAADTAAPLEAAFRDRKSGVWVESSGRAVALLADDDEGSRHQKFIVRVSEDLTVLMAHNIDLARRVPVEVGDEIEFRGEYEWNDRGGVVHWTHHDPRGRHEGGWIHHYGVRYK